MFNGQKTHGNCINLLLECVELIMLASHSYKLFPAIMIKFYYTPKGNEFAGMVKAINVKFRRGL